MAKKKENKKKKKKTAKVITKRSVGKHIPNDALPSIFSDKVLVSHRSDNTVFLQWYSSIPGVKANSVDYVEQSRVIIPYSLLLNFHKLIDKAIRIKGRVK